MRHASKIQLHNGIKKDRYANGSVANANQIIAKLLHGICCASGLYCFRIVGDEDCLKRFDNDHTLLVL